MCTTLEWVSDKIYLKIQPSACLEREDQTVRDAAGGKGGVQMEVCRYSEGKGRAAA